MQVGNLKYVFW